MSAPGFADVFVKQGQMVFADIALSQPDRASEMTWKSAQVTVGEAVKRLAPIYAEFLTADQAHELRKFFTSPVGQKVWAVPARAAAEGRPKTEPQLNAVEHRQVMSFTMSSAAWRAFNLSQPAIQKKIGDLSKQWGLELSERHMAGFRQQILDAVTGKENTASDQGKLSNSASPEQQLVVALREYRNRTHKGVAQYQDELKKLGLESVLAAENLTSREGIAQGRVKLDRFEAELNQRIREHNAASEEFVQTLKRIAEVSTSGSEFLKGAEPTLAKSFDRALRAEENQRTFIALSRQALTLFDENFGKIKNDGKQLLFDDEQDLRTYRELMQRIRKEIEVESQLEAEEQQAQQAGLRLLRGEPAPSVTKP